MARRENCLHYQVCLDTEARHLRIILAGDTAERCKRFMLSTEVIPKAKVEEMLQQIDTLIVEYLDGLYMTGQFLEIFNELKQKYTGGEIYGENRKS